MSRRRQRAQALVEFALIVPVLILILLGTVDAGRLIFAYNAVSNAAREGGRTAIVNQTPDEVRQRAAEQTQQDVRQPAVRRVSQPESASSSATGTIPPPVQPPRSDALPSLRQSGNTVPSRRSSAIS